MKPNNRLKTAGVLLIGLLLIGALLWAGFKATDYNAPVNKPVTQKELKDKLAASKPRLPSPTPPSTSSSSPSEPAATPPPAPARPGTPAAPLPSSGPTDVIGLFIAASTLGYISRIVMLMVWKGDTRKIHQH